MLIDTAKHSLGLVDDATTLRKFFEFMGGELGRPQPAPPEAMTRPAGTPLTEREQVDRINKAVYGEIKAHLAQRGIYGGDPSYSDSIKRVTAKVNDLAQVTARRVRTLEQANARLQAIKQLRDESVEYAP
jgi:hypothetical protein